MSGHDFPSRAEVPLERTGVQAGHIGKMRKSEMALKVHSQLQS